MVTDKSGELLDASNLTSTNTLNLHGFLAHRVFLSSTIVTTKELWISDSPLAAVKCHSLFLSSHDVYDNEDL